MLTFTHIWGWMSTPEVLNTCQRDWSVFNHSINDSLGKIVSISKDFTRCTSSVFFRTELGTGMQKCSWSFQQREAERLRPLAGHSKRHLISEVYKITSEVRRISPASIEWWHIDIHIYQHTVCYLTVFDICASLVTLTNTLKEGHSRCILCLLFFPMSHWIRTYTKSIKNGFTSVLWVILDTR